MKGSGALPNGGEAATELGIEVPVKSGAGAKLLTPCGFARSACACARSYWSTKAPTIVSTRNPCNEKCRILLKMIGI